MSTLNIGICGLGTVASGVITVLKRNAELISGRTGCDIRVTRVASRSLKDNCDMTGIEFSTDLLSLVKQPDVDVIAELIGGYDLAKEIVLEAIRNGKHVVTANKALIAEHGAEIFELAEKHQVVVAYEAGVAGAIPVIKALREGLSGNRVRSLAGIINGTGNFILTEMRDKGRAFDDVLAEAQALGYAEADPTFDVEGIDAAHKLTILASIAFGVPLQFKQTFTEGISSIESTDVVHAEQLGYRIKHLGIAKQTESGVELRVHPTLVPESQMIAKVDGVMNAVVVESDAAGQTLYYGAGAGSEATASAVVADIIDIARGATTESRPSLGLTLSSLAATPILSMEDIESAYYLRLLADDTPGVLAEVAAVLSREGINIESVMQKESEQSDGKIPLVMLTHATHERSMHQAIAQIEALPAVEGKVKKIRVEQFGA